MITKKAKLLHVVNNIYFKKQEPVSIVHFLTNRCNARCSFCFIDFDDPNTFKNELSLNEIDKLTKNFGNSLLNVNLTGGEPFARKDIIDIAKLYIKNTTIQSIYITTNASLPDRVEDFAKTIINFDKDIQLTFQISIDDMPEEHDRVRKISNLFESCIDTYKRLSKIDSRITPIVSITVNHENFANIEKIFNYLVEKRSVNSIKCTLVRDEGVFKTPNSKRQKIFEAYTWLTNKINELTAQKKLNNYNQNTIQGKLHNKKDKISWELVKKMYLKPKYISPCHAGSLFGIVTASGLVYPCEILEDKLIGNLREHDMNFMEIWKSAIAKKTKDFILKTNCNCSYECALTYNILGNWRYQPSLISSILNF